MLSASAWCGFGPGTAVGCPPSSLVVGDGIEVLNNGSFV